MHPLDRGLLALNTVLPEVSLDSLADWPLGRRNTALIELRCACFGRALRAWTACPRCAEKLEFELDGEVLLDRAPPGISSDNVEVGGQLFRLPTTRDVASVLQGAADLDRSARLLAETCRLPTTGSNSPAQPIEDLALEDIEESMALADPMAELLIELPCPACGGGQESLLDIVSFFWSELEARAKRLLREVHDLAIAYGWTESVVLSLSDHRRAIYLGMVRA
jgi:hypothetical protein